MHQVDPDDDDIDLTLCRLLSVPAESLLGRLASALAPLALDSPSLKEITDSLALRQAWDGTVVVRRAGAPLSLHCTVQSLPDPGGRQSGYLVFCPPH